VTVSFNNGPAYYSYRAKTLTGTNFPLDGGVASSLSHARANPIVWPMSTMPIAITVNTALIFSLSVPRLRELDCLQSVDRAS